MEDLTLYDPRQSQQQGQNLLHDSPLSFVRTPYLGQLLPPNGCQHVFCLKARQSQAPALDARPGPDSVYTVAAFCQLCRIHLRLRVDYTIRWEDSPCPNADRPFHHLVPSPWRENLARTEWHRDHPTSQDEIYVYECSSRTCSATVSVHLSPPELDEDAVRTLTDTDLLRQRTEDAFRTTESTEGMKHPLPIDVLGDLRAYLRNCWSKAPRPISLTNKRFITRFGPAGEACREVLEDLRFTLQVCYNKVQFVGITHRDLVWRMLAATTAGRQRY